MWTLDTSNWVGCLDLGYMVLRGKQIGTPSRVRRLVVPDDIPSIWSMPLKHLKRLGRSENKTGIFPSLVIQQ